MDRTNLPAYHPFRSAEAREEFLALYDQRAQRWPAPSESRTVDTSYGQTFVRVQGAAEAPPLVLLPGAASSSLMWTSNIEALSASFRTCAVDNIYDIGRSVYTRHLSNVQDFVAWLDDLFTALGLGDRVCLMGVSYGGWLTCHYALRHPKRLAAAVLIAPAATVLPISASFMVRAIASGLPGFSNCLGRWLFRDACRKDEATRQLAQQVMEDGQVAARCFARRKAIWPTIVLDEDLKRLEVPTLYVVGENEKIYSPTKAIARLAKVAPQIKTLLVAGAGHDLTVVQGPLMEKAVTSFLEGTLRGPTAR